MSLTNDKAREVAAALEAAAAKIRSTLRPYLDPATPVQVNGGESYCTFGEFIAVNSVDGEFGDAEIDEITATLARGEVYASGGGAAAEWSVSPCVPHFEGYRLADLPALPEGWADTTYGNDGSPSYQCGLSLVWLDRAEPLERFHVVELGAAAPNPRFGVVAMEYLDDGGPAQIGDGDYLMQSDDWAAVVDYVNAREALRRDSSARMAALTRDLHRIVSAMFQVYEDADHGANARYGVDMNALQPDGFPEVCAASLDEWAVECPGVADAWQSRGEV